MVNALKKNLQIEDWGDRAFRIVMCEFRLHDLFLWLFFLIMNLLNYWQLNGF